MGSAASEQLIVSELALQQQTALAAGKVVAQLYHLLQPLYPADDAQSFNKLCVRLVFCWYADAAGLWGAARFHAYLKSTTPDSCPTALRQLFSILNTPKPERVDVATPLAAFPYVNGGLFHQEPNEVQPELKFFDPACGSGNFLTETFVSLRRLENEVIRELHADQAFLGIAELNPVKVSLSQ